MADNKNDAFEAAVVDYFLRPAATAPTRPTAIYLGLATAATDTEVPTFTEAAYAGYARQALTFGASSQVSGGAKTSNTNGPIDFPAVAGGPLTFTHYVISDAASGAGTIVHMVVLIPAGSITCQTGDFPRVAVGGITHTET